MLYSIQHYFRTKSLLIPKVWINPRISGTHNYLSFIVRKVFITTSQIILDDFNINIHRISSQILLVFKYSPEFSRPRHLRVFSSYHPSYLWFFWFIFTILGAIYFASGHQDDFSIINITIFTAITKIFISPLLLNFLPVLISSLSCCH